MQTLHSSSGGLGGGGSRRVHRSHSEFLLAMGGQAPRVMSGGREPSVLSPSLSWGDDTA